MNSSILINSAISTGKPVMVARFGSVEIKGILYPSMPRFFRILVKERIFYTMANNAGFFSIDESSVEKFSELMLRDIEQLDILGSWRPEELLLRNRLKNVHKIGLSELEPYLSSQPWSQLLLGKRVLVVHPFASTIEEQYHNKRTLLFKDDRVLPVFKSLATIKAVQTISGQKSEFSDWFEALESMKIAIDKQEYDVAIIGCGAYGFPLAAHVKRSGKQAIHLGGATQILFGIKGKRWDNNPVIGPMYNEHWVRPAPEDVPRQAKKVEGGCYW